MFLNLLCVILSKKKRQFYDCIILLYTLRLQFHFSLPKAIDCDFQELALGIWASNKQKRDNFFFFNSVFMFLFYAVYF